jgi:hypothetical protein
LTRRAWIAYAVLLLLCLLTACSPSEQIAIRANGIAERAREDDAAWTRVGGGDANLPAEAKAGRARAKTTIKEAQDITRFLTGVEDQHPYLNAAIWIAGAVVALAAIVLLFQTGLGSSIKCAIGWIPRRKVSTAELAADMLDPNKPESDRELVAAMRSQDREFDAAYKRAVARRKV